MGDNFLKFTKHVALRSIKLQCPFFVIFHVIRSVDAASQQFKNITDVIRSQSQSSSKALNKDSRENLRDPRVRNQSEQTSKERNNSSDSVLSLNSAASESLEPHMARIRDAVDKVLGLGIRQSCNENSSKFFCGGML